VLRRLRNCRNDEILAERISAVTAPWKRAVGYLLRRDVEAGEGLWFDRCSMIHTVGMRASIDVVFVDVEQKIVRVVSGARRNRVFAGGPRAVAAIELRSGVATSHDLLIGDRLALE
jgi:uncharacterized membrane protein (UPF0127 family)